MKVTFVEPLGFSGIFRHAIYLMHSLQVSGVQIEMITSADNLELPADYDNLEIIQLLGGMNKSQTIIQRGINYLTSINRFLGRLWQRRPEIVHFHQYTTPYLDWLVFGIIRLSGFQLVLSLHDNEPRQRILPKWVNRRLLQLLYRIPRTIIVHSQFAKDALEKTYKVNPTKINVISLGNFNDQNTGLLSSRIDSRDRLGLPQEIPVILFFGTIRDSKGLHVMLEALKLLHEKNVPCLLVLAGEMERRSSFDEYQTHIQDLGLSDHVVVRLGYVPEELVSQYFSASDVVALPYLQIYQSAVLQLAYAFERPVVATDVGGISESVIDSQTGYLVPPGRPAHLAEGLRKIIQDPQHARQLGAQGRQFAEMHFNWGAIAKQTLAVYQAILD